jgi:hypothetical protein
MGSTGLLVCAAALGCFGFSIIVRSMRARHGSSRIALIAAGSALLVIGALGIRGALGLPREMTLQVCRANLKLLGAALLRYQANCGAFPPTLSILVQQGHLTAHSLQSPFRAELTGDHVDFIYVPGLLHSDPADWLIAVDPHIAVDADRTILLLSGDVRTISKAEYEAVLEAFKEAYRANRGEFPGFEMPIPP